MATVKVTGTKQVIANLRTWRRTRVSGLKSFVDTEIAPMLEGYMKNNRPWTDRTGNARRGLKVVTTISTDELTLRLWHTVAYGIYLEYSRAGRYAILNPTLQKHKRTVYNRIEKYWRS